MNKKGFTLIELVAVILIIGVLVTIATTAVFRHMYKVRKDSAYRNAISYVKAIDDYNFISEGTDAITSGSTSTISPKLKQSYDGTKPTSGTVTVDSTTKKVSAASLHFDGFVITYNGTNFTIAKE